MKRQTVISQLLFFAIIAIIVVGQWPLTCDAAVRARLDRQTITIDETVKLIIEADGALNSIANLDTSNLEKDFSIVDRSVNSNFQIINGTSKATKTWTIKLEAKQTGSFTIPSFNVGVEKTAALTLTVSTPIPKTSKTSKTLPEVFIEVTPEMDTPAYLQAQITINVKLFIKNQLRLTEASLEEPALKHATIIKLGDDRRYQSRKNDFTYQVIERKYAIIAEDGREITIPPLLFQAITTNGGNRRFPADPFFDRFSGRGQRLRARSQELTISLTQIPDEFKGKVWLPARKIAIMENLDEEKVLKVGEPLTRTIQIEALGLTAEQLPEIKPDAPDDGKIYLDQAEYQTEVDGALLHAVKRQAMAFIPSQEGLFTLPEVTIDWWDVVNNKQQKAVLPARVIKVIKADNGFADQPQRSNIKIEKKPRKAEPDSAKNPSPTSDTLTTKIVDADTTQLWKTISAMLLIAWIITVLLWRKTLRRQIAELKERDLTPKKKQTINQETIKQACLDNNPRDAHQAILGWGAANWPQNPPQNLKSIAARLENPTLGNAFANLEETLYSPDGRTWDGNYFWQTILPNLEKKAPGKLAHKQKKGLPPLYSNPA